MAWSRPRLRRRPPRYSAAALAWRGLRGGDWPRVWRDVALKRSYDAVIIGGGVHGLATAYYLARNHGITDVAVLYLARQGLPGQRRLGPQHGHRARQLPDARGRGLL